MTWSTQDLVAATSSFLGRRLSRRGFLMRTAVVGSAVATSGVDYVLRPTSAYASVCGANTRCADGYTAMCCTIHRGINQCPPGSFAGGWWKADDANLCGGKARYYVDCQAECTNCGCGGGSFCSERCWNCRPHCAHGSGCDHRRVCHNVFRYGQCERERDCGGPVLCRAISCTPPWEWLDCSRASATDDSTVSHSSHCLSKWGPILERYTEMGSQGSVLGASVGREFTRDGVLMQRYEHGRMFHHRHVGTHWLTGRVLQHYEHLPQARRRLGLPTHDQQQTADGELARFQHGMIAQRHGHAAFALWGAVDDKWRSLHMERGVLGFPTSDVSIVSGGVTTASFVSGDITQVRGASAYAIWGPVDEKWRSLAGGTGPLGWPTSDVTPWVSDGEVATFVTGDVAWTAATDAHAVWGPIDATWRENGGPGGSLGYPTSDVITAPDGTQTCTFQHGTVSYDPTTGQTVVTQG